MHCSGILIIVTVISQNLYPAHPEFLLLFATLYFHTYFQIKYFVNFFSVIIFCFPGECEIPDSILFPPLSYMECDSSHGNYQRFGHNRLKSDIRSLSDICYCSPATLPL